MSMEGKIKIILIDQPFLKILAEYFRDKFRDNIPDFSKIFVVFPSERKIPPRMLTMEELIAFIYEKIGGEKAPILQNIERNFFLKKVIDELKVDYWQDIPFLRFISIGNRLLNFFDELSQERITIE
ncbi:MAG: hypothetical protein N3A65_10265, partial [candidate division WOR-3 bacterium]|nr:hypothetical protein [candidate division WOR-3 bacterium]